MKGVSRENVEAEYGMTYAVYKLDGGKLICTELSGIAKQQLLSGPTPFSLPIVFTR